MLICILTKNVVFFCQAEDGILDYKVTGVQTCALPISRVGRQPSPATPFRAPWPVMADGQPVRFHEVPGHVFLVGDNEGQFPQSAAYVGVSEAEGERKSVV